eukprot:1196406-Prorocentrum_minimum.AAC.4
MQAYSHSGPIGTHVEFSNVECSVFGLPLPSAHRTCQQIPTGMRAIDTRRYYDLVDYVYNYL